MSVRCHQQHPKVRNVFNLDFPNSDHLVKTLTVVTGPDMVNLTYHNFFAYKEKVTQVIHTNNPYIVPSSLQQHDITRAHTAHTVCSITSNH